MNRSTGKAATLMLELEPGNAIDLLIHVLKTSLCVLSSTYADVSA